MEYMVSFYTYLNEVASYIYQLLDCEQTKFVLQPAVSAALVASFLHNEHTFRKDGQDQFPNLHSTYNEQTLYSMTQL